MGVIRISGPLAYAIGSAISGRALPEREAVFSHFKDLDQELIDSGLSIFFAGPRSFTGEDVVELQGHGGPVIQDLLMRDLIQRGARQARAGEFSERAFLNDKIDLTQAEAIADLIDSTTAAAARGAMRSLQGEFSDRVHGLTQELIGLRVYVEAAIDFPEEEIDFLADEGIRQRVRDLLSHLRKTLSEAHQGAILRNGLTIVLAGKPNAGKSSLLNILAGEQTAIVTDVPGTTRDIIRQTISLDGLPLHLIDTAGLRETRDQVEQIGVERARQAIEQADHVLHIVDATDLATPLDVAEEKTTLVVNKIDLLSETTQHTEQTLKELYPAALQISVTENRGIDCLKQQLKVIAGFQSEQENTYTARRRHLTALRSAIAAVERGVDQLQIHNAGELLADELLQAQTALSEITGAFSADDLLGEIFSGFCIGK